MVKLLTSILLLALLGNPTGRPSCQCQPATEGEVPHGANENLQFASQTVREIHGMVSSPAGQPSSEIIVEVFDIKDGDSNLDLSQIAEQRKRRRACRVGEDGKFCFTELPSGKYLIRTGVLAPGQFNMAYMEVRLDRRWWISWLRSNKDIELSISPGT